MMFRIGEPAFKSKVNTTLNELIKTGSVDLLIAKYEPAKGLYYRAALPYQYELTRTEPAIAVNQ